MLPRALNAALGIWLMAAPAVLGYGGAAATNHRIVGPVVASLAIIGIWEVTRPVRRVNAVLGGWLALSAWFLRDGTLAAFEPVVNGAVVGALVLGAALLGAGNTEQFGGGWGVLWGRRAAQPDGNHGREAT